MKSLIAKYVAVDCIGDGVERLQRDGHLRYEAHPCEGVSE
jgi:hypothetical protein